MRKIEYSEYERVEGLNHLELVKKGTAIFHRFGVDHQELEFGAGNYSTAIIELNDGTVKNLPVEQIKFID